MNNKLNNILKRTLVLASESFDNDEVPIGSVIFDDDYNIISESTNRVRRDKSVTKHSEMLAIELAGKKIGSDNLSNFNIATSLEPCAMCAQAIAWSKIKKIYIACKDEKSGGVFYNAKIFEHSHHKPEIIYLEIFSEESKKLMQKFFKAKRYNCKG